MRNGRSRRRSSIRINPLWLSYTAETSPSLAVHERAYVGALATLLPMVQVITVDPNLASGKPGFNQNHLGLTLTLTLVLLYSWGPCDAVTDDSSHFG